MRVSRRRVSNRALPTERFWQVVILTAAGAIGTVSHADAALYYWQDSDPSLSQPAPTIQPPRQRTHRRVKGKAEAAVKETSAKPQGPLIIAVSIDRQKVRIFDDNGVFAEAPVSTGMRGHPTPIGVFSVIQKHKFHHSNIYSGAPMPFMQRITWSGVAMHAGVLPGYPASHGCIRLTHNFASELWGMTRMGVRVIVAPEDVQAVEFAHPALPTPTLTPASAPVTNAERAKSAQAAAEAKLEEATKVAAEAGALEAAKTQEAFAAARVAWDAEKASDAATAVIRAGERSTEPISVFVSKKAGRIYIRQAWTPIREAPVTFKDPDLTLGTHVYVAMEPTEDSKAMRWLAVSLAPSLPGAETRARGRRGDRAEAQPAAQPGRPRETAASVLERFELA